QRRRGFLALDRNAARVFRIAPSHFPIGSGGKKFSVAAVNHVEKTIAVRLHNEMPLAVVHKHGNLRGVVIVLVMLGEWEIPLELSRVRIEREQGIAVE